MGSTGHAIDIRVLNILLNNLARWEATVMGLNSLGSAGCGTLGIRTVRPIRIDDGKLSNTIHRLKTHVNNLSGALRSAPNERPSGPSEDGVVDFLADAVSITVKGSYKHHWKSLTGKAGRLSGGLGLLNNSVQ